VAARSGACFDPCVGCTLKGQMTGDATMGGVLLAASLLVPMGCVSRVVLPSDPTASQQEQANRAIHGRSAELTFANGQTVDRDTARTVALPGDGTVAFSSSPPSASVGYWTRIPIAQVRTINAVDHWRGAAIGLLVGAVPCFAYGFVYDIAFPRDGYGSAYVAAGLLTGLFVGMIGAALGGAAGDGEVVTIAPEASSHSPSAAPR
jgi:hypothetical protein